MFTLPDTLAAWNTLSFAARLKQELQQLDPALLPLQADLARSSHVSDSPIQATILSSFDTEETITVRVGIFYHGIIAGSCCADDPTPVEELPEYCELELRIDRGTAATTAARITD